MFEQSLYEPEIVAAPHAEGDLFRHYEVGKWEFGPRVYRIVGISAGVNLLALLIFAQTSLLTMKGCDSPLVGNVCQALDMVYVGSAIFGTDRDYVDVAYEPTRIDSDDDVTFVDVTGETGPLYYPSDYMKYSDPERYAMQQQMAANPLGEVDDLAGIPITNPTTQGGSILDTPQTLPTPNPNVISGNLPTFNTSPTFPTRKGGRPGQVKVPKNPTVPDEDDSASAKPKPSPEKSPEKTPAEASPTPMSTDAVNAVEINKKPLTDFADDIAAKWAAQQVDLNKDFTLVLNGFITADGKLDKQKSKFDTQKTVGDPKMVDVGKAALEALGDSGYLTYLKSAGIEQITATLVQDDKQITVLITSTQKTPERAKTIESLVGGVILLGKVKVENPSDERTLLDGAKVSSDGKNFMLNFALPKDKAQEMITRKLKEAQAKKQQAQPNGGPITKSESEHSSGQ